MPDEPKPQDPVPGKGAKPARVVGPVAPAIYTPGAKTGSYRRPAEVAEPLVTEGMKARQREIDKKRRVVAMLRQVEEEEAEDRWRHARRWIYRVVALLVVIGVYVKIQMTWGNRWPIWTVWVFLGTMIVTALFWLFWYVDYSD